MRKDKVVEDLGIIIAAGGSSSRFSLGKSKLLVNYNGVPLFIYTLKQLIGICNLDHFVIVVKDDECARFADLISEHIPNCDSGSGIKVIPGGATRMHSVSNGLGALPKSAKFAAIHDAARPMVTSSLLLGCLKEARLHENGAVVAKRMTNTIKRASSDNMIVETLDRDNLWSIETPQIFSKEKLICAYRKAFKDGVEVTDDSGVMEHSGFAPFLFEYKEENKKITFIEDLTI